MSQPAQLAARDDEVRLCLRHGHRLPDGHRHIGQRKYRSVIQAIAHHQHPAALALQSLKPGQFALRRAVALHMLNTQSTGHAQGCRTAVAGQHLNLQPGSLEL